MPGIVVVPEVEEKLFGPLHEYETAPGELAEILAVEFWQIFAGTITLTAGVATTDTLDNAVVLHVKLALLKKAIAV